jgi:hypothetical protein
MSNSHIHPVFQNIFNAIIPPADDDGQEQAQAEPQPCNAIVNLMVGGYMREAKLLEEAESLLLALSGICCNFDAYPKHEVFKAIDMAENLINLIRTKQ